MFINTYVENVMLFYLIYSKLNIFIIETAKRNQLPNLQFPQQHRHQHPKQNNKTEKTKSRATTASEINVHHNYDKMSATTTCSRQNNFMKSYYGRSKTMHSNRVPTLTAQLLLVSGLLLWEYGLTEAASSLTSIKETGGEFLY